MKLLQHGLQLLRDGQAEVRGVLHETDAFIGDVEKDNRRPKYTAGADHLRIQNMTDAYQQEDQDLAADTLEADLAGQLLIGKGAHDTGDVVDGHEGQKCVEQTPPMAVNTS